jgi:hypothetical protein
MKRKLVIAALAATGITVGAGTASAYPYRHYGYYGHRYYVRPYVRPYYARPPVYPYAPYWYGYSLPPPAPMVPAPGFSVYGPRFDLRFGY